MNSISEPVPQPAVIEAFDCEKEGESTKGYKAMVPLPPVPSEAGPENDGMYEVIPGESDNPMTS